MALHVSLHSVEHLMCTKCRCCRGTLRRGRLGSPSSSCVLSSPSKNNDHSLLAGAGDGAGGGSEARAWRGLQGARRRAQPQASALLSARPAHSRAALPQRGRRPVRPHGHLGLPRRASVVTLGSCVGQTCSANVPRALAASLSSSRRHATAARSDSALPPSNACWLVLACTLAVVCAN